jgi:hypothetical protein
MDGYSRLITYPFTCPRCRSVSYLMTKHPYCQGCNWDSLTDVTNERKVSNKKEEVIEQKDEEIN